MIRIIAGFLVFILPSFLGVLVLKSLGHKVSLKTKIGFSFIISKSISIEKNVKIGHFNLIIVDKLNLANNVRIGYLNILKGPFDVLLKDRAAIGNKNYFTRGRKGITFGESKLTLGELTKITTGHHIDLTQGISIGNFSIIAGVRSQMWTHGYYHANIGKDRIRIDGEIHIGDNVYVGSGCIFNPGVKIANAVHIGGGSVISKDLNNLGMYVSQELRFIDNSFEKVKKKLEKVDDFDLVEEVYKKKQ